MKSIVLPFETQAATRFNRKLVLNAPDLAKLTSGTAQAVVPENALGVATLTLPKNVYVGRVMVNVATAFTSSGGAITTLTLGLGDGGSATRFLNAVDLKTAALAMGTSTGYLYTVADTLDITVAIVGQTMASLNAGQVEIYLELIDVNGVLGITQP